MSESEMSRKGFETQAGVVGERQDNRWRGATVKIFALGSGDTAQAWRMGLGAAGIAIAFLAAPTALADETDTTLAGGPVAEASTSVTGESVLAATPVDSAPTPADASAAAVTPAAAPAPVSHLSSPDNLPPGTTDAAPQKQTRLGYLRDMWHAIQTQDVTMSDAVLFLAQRPLDASATPPAGVAMGPSGPVGTSAPAAVVAPAAAAATP